MGGTLMSAFEIILCTAAVQQVVLLAMVNSTRLDIKTRLHRRSSADGTAVARQAARS
jgi:hypothetical protein